MFSANSALWLYSVCFENAFDSRKRKLWTLICLSNHHVCTTQQHGEANKQKALPHKKSYFIAHLGPPTTSTIIVLHSSKARLFYFEKKHHFHACFLWDTQKIVVVVVEVAIFLSIYGSQARFCERKIIDTDVSFWQKIQLWM